LQKNNKFHFEFLLMKSFKTSINKLSFFGHSAILLIIFIKLFNYKHLETIVFLNNQFSKEFEIISSINNNNIIFKVIK
jgi:hypothetical protein